jgi:hypothetical protein
MSLRVRDSLSVRTATISPFVRPRIIVILIVAAAIYFVRRA